MLCVIGLCKVLTNATDGSSHSDILKVLNGVQVKEPQGLWIPEFPQVSTQYYSELEHKHAHKRKKSMTTVA